MGATESYRFIIMDVSIPEYVERLQKLYNADEIDEKKYKKLLQLLSSDDWESNDVGKNLMNSLGI